MADLPTNPSKPLVPSLPPPQDPSFFTPTQWSVYLALCDAALPSIVPTSALTNKTTHIRLPDTQYEEVFATVQDSLVQPPTREQFAEYLSERATENPEFVALAQHILGDLPPGVREKFGGALNLLASPVGAFILTGTCTPFHTRPLHAREAVLRRWKDSWFSSTRLLYKSVTLLAKTCWFRTSKPFISLSGYPTVPRDWKPTPSFPFKFITVPAAAVDTAVPEIIETDVVIVGSGCGGAVVARYLAAECGMGNKVLMVDKGYHFDSRYFPMPQREGCELMFEGKGVVSSDDNSTNITAGSCWGGGGAVNWSVCLEPQEFVRQEWAEKDGLPFFARGEEGGDFQKCLDHVAGVMGVATEPIRHNVGNSVILDGCRKLGWECKEAPQNSGGKEHYCGQCHFGCHGGEKQGPTNRWLPDAAEAGARFMEGLAVEKVLFKDVDGVKTATGVVGTWKSRDKSGGLGGPMEERIVRKVEIRAKKVVVASGSIHSPLLLLRSGLENPHIGNNLHIHPCHIMAGKWDEERRPWEGGISTSLCTKLENLDGEGHGTKLEPVVMVPYVALSTSPWMSGLQMKLLGLKYRQMNGFITLTRDRDSGRVYPDRTTGQPRIAYTPSDLDRAHCLEGVFGLAKLCYVSGAEEIHAFLPGNEPFVRTREEVASYDDELLSDHDESGKKLAGSVGFCDPEKDDPRFKAWLDNVRAKGNAAPYATFTSAHQMGTCRMSAGPDSGVVDGEGKVWGTSGLFVADASVFPSASGVNPMLTNMGIAHWIAQGIGKDMKKQT